MPPIKINPSDKMHLCTRGLFVSYLDSIDICDDKIVLNATSEIKKTALPCKEHLMPTIKPSCNVELDKATGEVIIDNLSSFKLFAQYHSPVSDKQSLREKYLRNHSAFETPESENLFQQRDKIVENLMPEIKKALKDNTDADPGPWISKKIEGTDKSLENNDYHDSQPNKHSLNLPHDSFIHFYWAGKIPSPQKLESLLGLQRHLKKQKSEFNVSLWLAGDLFHQIVQPNENLPLLEYFNINLLDNRQVCLVSKKNPEITIFINSFDTLLAQKTDAIAAFNEDQLTESFASLVEYYEFMIRNQLYPFASDFARMVILDTHCGFYCDFDMALKSNNELPESMNALRSDFELGIADPRNFIAGNTNIHNKHTAHETEVQTLLSLYPNAFFSQKQASHIIGWVEDYTEEVKPSLENNVAAYKKVMDKLNKALQEDPALTKTENKPLLELYHNERSVKVTNLPKVDWFQIPPDQQARTQRLIKSGTDKFQFFYQEIIDSYFSESTFLAPLRSLIDTCFENPKQEKTLCYSWMHPLQFHTLPSLTLTNQRFFSAQNEASDIRDDTNANDTSQKLKNN